MRTNEYLRRTQCPICAGPAADAKVAVQSNPPAESLPFGAHGEFLSGYASRRVFFSYSRCLHCGGLFCPVYFTQAQLDTLYAHQPENLVDVPLSPREATCRAYFDLLRKNVALTGEYLELGPDIGLFAGLCAEAGSFSMFHLYEPNLEVHGALANRLRGRPISISSSPYSQGVAATSGINVAVAIHVLDHMIDPASALRALHHILARDARLFLVTHDEASLLARILGRRWPPFTLQHPQLYSRGTIARLLERCGFRVIGVEKSVNYFPVTLLMRASLNVLGIQRWPGFLNLPWQIGLKLGNIATIAAKQ